ncbi:hypothetical protein LMH73_013090, partial [Vibrio splendidus]
MTIDNETIQYGLMAIGLIIALPWLKQMGIMIWKMLMVRFNPIKSVTVSGLDINGNHVLEVVALSDSDK